MGNGFYRSVPCGPSCSGAAREMMLFAPVALASGPDGSLYIGDFNFIRRLIMVSYAVALADIDTPDLFDPRCERSFAVKQRLFFLWIMMISPTVLQALHSPFLCFLKRKISMGLHSHLSCRVLSLCNLTLSFAVIVVIFLVSQSLYLILLHPLVGNAEKLPV
ncbi:hypothetical protein GOODEAATRI_021657 [Goodea atripinnis]|uniref:Teneurin NHL domain-containing protein n=1 Tax=Goodea atripinnis TaxID=208336 RepID=A0ABV0PFV4_9TELE